MTMDQNVYPYFDDYSSEKGFYKILVKPSNPVQARELNQIQTMIQEQIRRMGNHFFRNGTVIIPGHIYFDNTYNYVKIAASNNSGAIVGDFISQFVGKRITSSVTGLSAIVVHVEQATGNDPITAYIRYTSSNGSITAFSAEDVLTEEESGLEINVSSDANFVGSGSLCTINEGIYYINGYFVGVNKQTVAIGKYTNTPSATIGLSFDESVVTAATDSSLYDNAQGYPNYTAEGADRYKIALTLTSKDVNYTESDQNNLKFIDLMQVKNGEIQYQYNDTRYAEFERMFARRTYDESGDYIVDDFKLVAREYRSNNRGLWVSGTPYIVDDIVVTTNGTFFQAFNSGVSGTTEPLKNTNNPDSIVYDGIISWRPVLTPRYNGGIFSTSSSVLEDHLNDAAKYAIQTSSGKAYIKGFEIKTNGKQDLIIDKARDTAKVNDVQIAASTGRYVLVSNVLGVPNITTCTKVQLWDSTYGADPLGEVGSAFVKNIEYVSGTIGSGAVYKLFLFGISMKTGKEFAVSVDRIKTSPNIFSADVVVNYTKLESIGRVTSAGSTLNGEETLFSSILKVGNVIKYGAIASRIVSVANQVTLTTTATLSIPADTPISEVYVRGTTLYGVADTGLVKLPNDYVKTLRDSLNQVDTAYTCTRMWSGQSSNPSGSITLTIVLPENGETFMLDGHIITTTAGGAPVNASYAYEVLPGGALNTKRIIISGLAASTSYNILTKVKRVGAAAKEKTKTLRSKVIKVSLAGGITDVTDPLLPSVISGMSSTMANDSYVSLTECDVQRINKVVTLNGTGEDDIDITPNYLFDHGQTEYAYGVSKIWKIDSNQQNTTDIKIYFEYFEHSTGDYFSVDSYVGIPYSKISAISMNGNLYKMFDYLDFRPRYSDDGSGFSAAGASVPSPLASTDTMSTSYSYYLPRIDVVSLNSTGEFVSVLGTSSVNPVTPNVSVENSIKIASVLNLAYTFDAAYDTSIEYFVHRRYTMEDIGKLDSRLSNVEQYVALSALEKATADMLVYDENGLNRFKSGFLVDQFKDGLLVDLTDSELGIAIDTANRVMTAGRIVDRILATRSTKEYSASETSEHGDFLLMPYLSKTSANISQPYATRTEFVNPFAVVTFYGNSTIFPSLYQWNENNKIVYETQGTTKKVSINQTMQGIDRKTYTASSVGKAISALVAKSDAASQAAAPGMILTSKTLSTNTAYGDGYDKYAPNGQRIDVTLSALYEYSSYVTQKTDILLETITKMRPKTVVVNVTKLKPTTNINVSMDNENINGITQPCTVLVFNQDPSAAIKGFADTTDVSEIDVMARLSGNDVFVPRMFNESGVVAFANYRQYDFFYRGTVVGATYGAGTEPSITAVVVAKEKVGSQWYVYVTNVMRSDPSATFVGKQLMFGPSTSNGSLLWANTAIPCVSSFVPSLQTNALGNFYGLIKFNSNYKTGEHLITVKSATGDEKDGISSATFTAFGNRLTTTSWVTTNKTIVDVKYNMTNRVDPLAQTFLINASSYPNGVISHRLDLFFDSSKVKSNEMADTVEVDIVTVENGYPTQIRVPGSLVIKPISQLATSTTSDLATTFNFADPVYLEPGKEYAIRIKSNNINIKSWVAQAGEQVVKGSVLAGSVVDAGTLNSPTNVIGSLFKSQNASTWTAEQTQDLKFSLFFYEFNVSKSAIVDFVIPNKVSQYAWNLLDLIESETINASPKLIRYKSFFHGFSQDQDVYYYVGSTLYKGKVIKVVDINHFVLMTQNAAHVPTAVIGGIKYENFALSPDMFVPAGNADFEVKHYDSSMIADSAYSLTWVDNEYKLSSPKSIVFEDDNGEKTMKIRCYLSSTDRYTSPILRKSNFGVVIMTNGINDVDKTDYLFNATISGTTITNYPLGGHVITGTGVVGGVQFHGPASTLGDNYITIHSPNIDFAAFKVGAMLKIAGCVTTAANNTTSGVEAQIIDIDYQNAAVFVDKVLTTQVAEMGAVYLTQYTIFVDEISPDGGSALARYQHIPATLDNPATALKIMFAASIPNGVSVDVYYRTNGANSATPLDEKNWTKIDTSLVNTSPDVFIDREIDVDNIEEFEQYQIKLVSRSENTAAVASFKDLRVIALA